MRGKSQSKRPQRTSASRNSSTSNDDSNGCSVATSRTAACSVAAITGILRLPTTSASNIRVA